MADTTNNPGKWLNVETLRFAPRGMVFTLSSREVTTFPPLWNALRSFNRAPPDDHRQSDVERAFLIILENARPEYAGALLQSVGYDVMSDSWQFAVLHPQLEVCALGHAWPRESLLGEQRSTLAWAELPHVHMRDAHVYANVAAHEREHDVTADMAPPVDPAHVISREDYARLAAEARDTIIRSMGVPQNALAPGYECEPSARARDQASRRDEEMRGSYVYVIKGSEPGSP